MTIVFLLTKPMTPAFVSLDRGTVSSSGGRSQVGAPGGTGWLLNDAVLCSSQPGDPDV